jgi:parallel beta-helix repeat protein
MPDRESGFRAVAALLVVVLFLGAIGTLWLGASDRARPAPTTDEPPTTPTVRLGGGPVGQGGPLPESPALSFDPPTADGEATVDGQTYDSLATALAAASPGDTVRVTGRFSESVRLETPNLTVVSPPGSWGLIADRDAGVAIDVRAPDVTLRGLWVRGDAANATGLEPAMRVRARNLTLERTRLTDVGFGIRGERADGLRVENLTVVGRPDAADGIRLWRTEDPVVTNARFTNLRDAIRYEWVTGGRTAGTTAWDVRYSMSVLSSSHHAIRDNRYFNNDVGVILLHSTELQVVGNRLVNNTGRSGHGIILNAVEDSLFRNNTLLSNEDGFFVDNAVGNRFVGNNISYNGHGVVFDADQNELAGNVIAHNRFGVIVVKPVAESLLERISQDNTFEGNRRQIFRSDW